MKIKTFQEVQDIIKAATEFQVIAEDRIYEIKPASWYTHTPWIGIERLYYVAEAADCDDFCDILKAFWLKQHWKKALGPVEGGGSYPALPVFRCKVKFYNTDTPHWIMLAVCEEGVRFFERTEENIFPIGIGQIKNFLRIV